MPKRKTRLPSLTLRQSSLPVRRNPRRSTRTRRTVTGKLSLTLPRAKRSATTNSLAECKIEGCQEITTVGPLCLTHWEEKVMHRQSKARPAPTGSKPSPSSTNGPAQRRWLVIPAPSPSTGHIRPVWLHLPL